VSQKKDWADVFAAYPDVEMIYVCDGQPFVEHSQALSHQRSLNKVRTVKVEIERVEHPDVIAKRKAQAKAEAEAKAKEEAEAKAKEEAEAKAKAEAEAKADKPEEPADSSDKKDKAKK
jgi:membrane protein involved in colicin uptake